MNEKEKEDYPLQWNAELKPSDWSFYVEIPRLKDIPYSSEQTFSIVIPNWRHTAFLPTVIRSIVIQEYPEDKYEIIIIDDNSKDLIDFSGENFSVKLSVFEVMDLIKEKHPKTDISFYETHQNVTFNICKAANIGFKRAKYENIIINPADAWQMELYMQTASSYMDFFKKQTPDNRFAISGSILTDRGLDKREITDVGLVAKKDDLYKITGYNEKMKGWGSNEGNITGRLGLSGVREGYTPDLVIATYLPTKCLEVIGIPWPGNPDRLSEMVPNKQNGIIDNQNYAESNYAPNDDSWGELDTLEKVF